MATVDVLIPHYRDPIGLDASLRSVAAQNWTGTSRVLVLDDGSPAAELDEVTRVVRKFPASIALLKNETNVGRPITRNRLLAEADAPYIAWLDSGDIWHPDKLRIQFEHLRHLELNGRDLQRVWVTCHYEWCVAGEEMRVRRQKVDGDQLQELLNGNNLRAYLWTLLGRKEAFKAVGLFDEKLPRLQDLDYFVRFVRAGGILEVPSTSGALCRYYKSDVGRKHAQVARSAERILQKHRSAYEKYGRGFLKRALWKNTQLSARFAIQNRAYGAALYYLLRGGSRMPKYALYRMKQRIFSQP